MVKFKKIIRKSILIVAITLISSNLCAPELNYNDKELKELNKSNIIELESLMFADFSKENLRRFLELLIAPHADIIMNQAKLESGWFKSRLFVYQNNLFGMHYPYRRETYSDKYVIADNGARVASYGSWQSSVLDLLIYFEYYKDKGYDMTNYYQFLIDAGYCVKGSKYVLTLIRMSL